MLSVCTSIAGTPLACVLKVILLKCYFRRFCVRYCMNAYTCITLAATKSSMSHLNDQLIYSGEFVIRFIQELYTGNSIAEIEPPQTQVLTSVRVNLLHFKWTAALNIANPMPSQCSDNNTAPRNGKSLEELVIETRTLSINDDGESDADPVYRSVWK